MDESRGDAVDEARLLDEVAAAATPAQRDDVIGGWWCKCSPDLPFRRANAVLPGADAGADPTRDRAVLAQVRAHYGSLGRRLVVQVADRSHDRLDAVLAGEGLDIEAPVEVLATEPAGFDRLAGLGRPGRDGVSVARGVDEAWSRAYGTIAGGDARDRRRTTGYGRMLEVLGDRALAAGATRDGAVVGVGYGVVDRGWLGVFGMATAPHHRRRGVARSIVVALAGDAAALGARRAYLQVETDNVAAHALYAHLGFGLHHRYHYRSEAEPPGAQPLRSGSDGAADLC